MKGYSVAPWWSDVTGQFMGYVVVDDLGRPVNADGVHSSDPAQFIDMGPASSTDAHGEATALCAELNA